ncbi:hypothetical protein N6L26_12090 [Qipengyuania sp. SS22]|uniref:hypothetical protein n=1 Tax=Qipengyuania sp. SS22 TaxID=2979461 RepID=UPI0021E57AE2|nr:hypothetical protein [Qipengyuania sp. SS22]UYH54768.1 hypothetical protein N6L26_12090 [Qipengyuania sp. SS22]
MTFGPTSLAAAESLAAAAGIYLVGSLVFAALLVRMISSSWPGKMLHRHVWLFPFAPAFAVLALTRFILLLAVMLVDRTVRGVFKAISGKPTRRRIPFDPYRGYGEIRSFR